MVLHQLTPYLKTNKRLVEQSRKKEWHSTETSILVVSKHDAILKVVDKRKLTAIIYVDMSKVFDSINHSILLQKLKAIGPAPSHQWSPGLTATCPTDLKWFALMLHCLMLYQHGVWNVTKQAKLSYISKVFLKKTGSFQCGAVDIKRLYEKHV